MSDAHAEEQGFPHFGIHHLVPQQYGKRNVGIPRPLRIAEIDLERARQPVNPGMPPVNHIPLPAPDGLRLLPPPGVAQVSIAAPVASPIMAGAQPTAIPAENPVAVATVSASEPPMIRLEAPAPPRPEWLEGIDPIFAYLLYLALGVGTAFLLDTGSRYVMLWGTLILLGGILHLLDAPRGPGRITSTDLTWGVVFGIVIGLPLILLAGPGLATTSSILFPNLSTPALFQLMVLTAPLGETLFFRGVMQEKRGFGSSVVAVAFAAAVVYWPTAIANPVYLGVGVIFSTALAAVYSYAASRYGLAAAFLCQATANLMLVFLPTILLSPSVPVL